MDLIARLEQAEVGSRELDRAVALALGWAIKRWPNGQGEDWRRIDGTLVLNTNFSTSLDAALTLVPTGWHWTVYDTDGLGRGYACAQVEPPEYSYEPISADAVTPALALCIACLRARLAAEQAP